MVGTPGLTTESSESTGSQSDTSASPDAAYGCSEIDTASPGFVDSDEIRGHADLKDCVNIVDTLVEICMKDSKTYGLHACRDDDHEGTGNWTAYTGTFACQGYTREWQTTGTVEFVAVDGESSLWGISSPWSSAFTC
jgi:hypothetical protein